MAKRPKDHEAIISERKAKLALGELAPVRFRLMLTVMLQFLFEALNEDSPHEARDDMAQNLQTAGQRIAQDFPHGKVVQAKYALDLGLTIINGSGKVDHRHALVAWCQIILKLQDEGLYPDSDDQCILAALGVVHEAMVDDPESWNYDKSEITPIFTEFWRRIMEAGEVFGLPKKLIV